MYQMILYLPQLKCFTDMVCFGQTGLPGFYDPCVGEEKSLKVLYQFRGVMHQVLSGDTEALRIPKQCKSLLFLLCYIAM